MSSARSDSGEPPGTATSPDNVSESRKDIKVKVFYTFQGSDTTCLCSFTIGLNFESSAQYVQVPLKDCLMALCASCPDMLLYPDADCAVYSANFQEGSPGKDQVVWEGHGLLSWILDSDNGISVSGKLSGEQQYIETHRISKTNYYHTLVHRRGPRSTQDHRLLSSDDVSHPFRRVISLPSMQSTLSPPPPATTEDSMNAMTLQHPSYPCRVSPPSSLDVRHHRYSYPYPSDDARVLPPISRLSPDDPTSASAESNRSGSSSSFFPPLSETRYPAEDAEQNFKKRKLSPPAAMIMETNNNSSNTGMPRSRTSPTLSLPPPSALLEFRQENNRFHSKPQAYDDTSIPRTSSSSTSSSYATAAPQPSSTAVVMTRMPTQHTAIGRRKKRDTKPPNVNDVRTFVQVDKDENGNYRLPVEIDSWTVLSLGKVVYDRPAFHNQRYIYPVGYKVKKWYRSMVDPRSDTQYTCEILDGGQEPIFRLEADDNPGEVYMGPTPTTVWTIAVRRAFAIRNMDYGHNPVGPDFFGLRKNTIAKMIQDLPNADKCKNYIWQTFKIGTTGRTARGKIFRSEDVTEASESSSTGAAKQQQQDSSSS